MSYELINEESRIYSFSVSDLTMRQANDILKVLDNESTLGTLTVYYDQDDDRIVLNKDHKLYETYKDIILGYINQPQDIKKQLKDEIICQPFKDVFNVMDKAQHYREVREKVEEINILINYQILPNNYNSIMDELDNIYEHKIPSMSRFNIYTYGYIQGKRAERAKKKKKLLAEGNTTVTKENTTDKEGDYIIMENKSIIDITSKIQNLNNKQLDTIKKEIDLFCELNPATAREKLFKKVENTIYGIGDVCISNNHGVRIGTGANLLYNEAENENVSLCYMFDDDIIELYENNETVLKIDKNSPILEAFEELFRQLYLSDKESLNE